jgi:hypothetical protein
VRAKPSFADEFRVRHCSGQWRWVSVRAVPLRDPEGNVSGWIGMNADITPQKLAEAGRERQLREMVENAPHSVAMLDRNIRYVEVSPRWLREFGLELPVSGRVTTSSSPSSRSTGRRCIADAWPARPSRTKANHSSARTAASSGSAGRSARGGISKERSRGS